MGLDFSWSNGRPTVWCSAICSLLPLPLPSLSTLGCAYPRTLLIIWWHKLHYCCEVVFDDFRPRSVPHLFASVAISSTQRGAYLFFSLSTCKTEANYYSPKPIEIVQGARWTTSLPVHKEHRRHTVRNGVTVHRTPDAQGTLIIQESQRDRLFLKQFQFLQLLMRLSFVFRKTFF